MKIQKAKRLIVIGCLAFATSICASFAFFAPVESARQVVQQPTASIQSHPVGSERIANAVSTVSSLNNEHLLRCLSSDATDIRKIASQKTTSQAGGVTHELSYHLFNYYRRGYFQEAVILDFKGVCGLAYDSEFGLEMSEMVPMDVARSLVLQDYQASAVALGGVEELERSFLEEGLVPSLNGTLPRFAPERIWALAQLGIHPPEDKYTVKDITPYEPGRFSR